MCQDGRRCGGIGQVGRDPHLERQVCEGAAAAAKLHPRRGHKSASPAGNARGRTCGDAIEGRPVVECAGMAHTDRYGQEKLLAPHHTLLFRRQDPCGLALNISNHRRGGPIQARLGEAGLTLNGRMARWILSIFLVLLCRSAPLQPAKGGDHH
jgi:hypothetical protein